MNITVTEVEGLPAHTYISVRYGEMRRQTPFRTGEALSFPTSIAAEKLPKAYTVDVFRKVASKQVSLAGITALGGTIKHKDLVIPSLDIQGTPITVSLTASLQHAQSAPFAEDSKKKLVAARAKQYLEKHGVQSVLHEMFAQLLESLPGDPLAFMVNYLEQKQDEMEEQRHETRRYSAEPGLGDTPFPGFADGQDLPDMAQHHSIMADVLRKDVAIYKRLCNQKTNLGVSLAQCVKSGIDCPGHELVKVAGAYAGDDASYELFRDLFDPIISALHTGQSSDGFHPTEGNPAKLTNAKIDPTGQTAVFASMEIRRNFHGIRFSSCCLRDERREVERMLTKVLEDPTGEFKGTYYPLRDSQSHVLKMDGMTAHQEESLRKVGMLFAEPDSKMRLSAGLGRHWPDARGVFVSETQGLYLWCNEEDHVRLFARQDSIVDLKKLWTRVDTVIEALAEGVAHEGYEISHTSRLGYITTCPSRLGEALRISVSLRVPLLARATNFPALCRSLDLQSSQEVESTTHGSIWNVSSTDCLGISAVDLINETIEGCKMLVELEERLRRGEPIYDAMPGLGNEPFPGFPTDQCPVRMPDLSCNYSHLAAVLNENPRIYNQLRKKKTNMGVGLAPCIKPGIDDKGHPKSVSSGIVAGDAASYETFHELFTPVISRLNSDFVPGALHPMTENLSELSNIDIDPTGSHVVSVHVEFRRNLHGLRLAPCCTSIERREVESLFVRSIMRFSENLDGEYLPLACSNSYAQRPGGISSAEQARFCAEDLLFSEPSAPSRLAAGLGYDWPDARGAFLTNNHELSIWCNEEEHLRFIAKRNGGDLRTLFGYVFDCVNRLEVEMKNDGHGYMHDRHLGYLTVDPAHLGNGLRCSITMRLPQLSVRADFFAICSAFSMHAAWQNGAWNIGSGPRLGLSQVDLVNMVIQSSAKLIHLEQQLNQGYAIEGTLQRLGIAT